LLRITIQELEPLVKPFRTFEMHDSIYNKLCHFSRTDIVDGNKANLARFTMSTKKLFKKGVHYMYRRSFSTIVVTILCLLLAGAFLTGCNTKTQTDKPSDSVTPPVLPATDSVKLTLYFPNSDATGLIPTVRTVEVNDQDVIKAMFIELATPPSGLEKPLPSGTTLLEATISADGIATIDLSTEFQKNFGGGSAGEQMTIYSIVNTLTTLPNVQSVQFLLDGNKHDGILGHLDTTVPIKPNESLIIKPQ